MGLLLVVVLRAADIQDRNGAKFVLGKVRALRPAGRDRTIVVDKTRSEPRLPR
jgi:hypothetical protein